MAVMIWPSRTAACRLMFRPLSATFVADAIPMRSSPPLSLPDCTRCYGSRIIKTQARARTKEAIPSAGHPSGYAGFSGASKGLPTRAERSEP
jgi:hypothetical protein